MPLVAPGMKMVFPLIRMGRVFAGRSGPTRERLSGDRRSLDGAGGARKDGDMDRDALAEFLRRHRETLQPADVGLGAGARRRAPGLRREEVAQLATMSTDYYTRLEQRRGPQPSTQMLAALAPFLAGEPKVIWLDEVG